MDAKDRRAIEDLFRRISEASRAAPPRDPEAEDFIDHQLSRTPGAPYYMAQTMLVQETALARAEERIADLEACLAEHGRAGTGLLADLWSGAPNRRRRSGRNGPARHGVCLAAGNGFLEGAAQTAMGVAGGLLIANAITGMFAAGAVGPARQWTPHDAAPDDVDSDGGGLFDDFDL